jgi:hypothetical protein
MASENIIENILKREGVLLDKECVVCYKKFINVKDKDYTIFYDKIEKKYKLPQKPNIFEDSTTCMCYDQRFECLTCKNIVCCGCIMNMPDNENGKRLDGYAMFCNGYTEIVYETIDMEQTGIITCPICRTIDKRLLDT